VDEQSTDEVGDFTESEHRSAEYEAKRTADVAQQ